VDILLAEEGKNKTVSGGGVDPPPLNKVPKNEIGQRMKELSDLLGLDKYMDKLILDLSGGWRRRTAIACALMHRPSILFLDEPTAGLDTQSRHVLWDIVRDLRNAGTMVFLTTHYMDEAEALCDRVAIIDGGKIIAEGSPTFLNELVGKIAIDYEIDGKGTTQTFSTRDEAREFITAHLPPESTYSLRKTTLEDVFLKLTGNHMRGAKDVQDN
jgi:ABC-2 type transport system ATP-binding protein